MSDIVLFKMDDWDRRMIVERHTFYVEQAIARLLPPFEDLEAEARKAAEEWLHRASHRFNPEISDPADFYEAAQESAMDFCGQLLEMREQVLLSIVAAMFHHWEKDLREWLTAEIRHWNQGEGIIEAVWNAKPWQLEELLTCIGWQGQNEDYFKTLDACRLVVNVYKHGFGSSLKELAEKYPEYEDPAGRRITEPGFGPLFSDVEEEGDLATGYVYVARSCSDNPFVSEHRDVIHKIGVTGGDVKTRIANARKDPTYLLADVELVATYKLANVNRKALESLLRKCFSSARLDLTLKDRFGGQVEPQEWFLVPLPVIDEAMERLKAGTLAGVCYDVDTAQLV